MNGAPLYSLRNVRRSFGGREVLSIPDLTLDKGKIYALLGPNGAGKTTLMRLLAFMDAPTEGEIFFEGQKVNPEQRGRYRARVVWAPQTPVLFTGSLLYNVEYPLRLKGVPRRRRRGRAMELLESVGLAHLAQAQARRLSGGEAQRGSIARALAAGAEVILFDEPTANVDFRSREEIMHIIQGLWRERGLSLMVTTHDKALADALAHEEISLFDGKVLTRKTVGGKQADFGGEEAIFPIRFRRCGGRLCAVLQEERPDAVVRDERPKAVLDPADTLAGRLSNDEGIIRALEEDDSGAVLIRLQGADGRRLDMIAAADADAATARRLMLGDTLSLARDA